MGNYKKNKLDKTTIVAKTLILKNKLKGDITSINNIMLNQEKLTLINNLKNKFLFCEILYKRMYDLYKKLNNPKSKKSNKELIIKVNYVVNALNFFNIPFEENAIKYLFGPVKEGSIKAIRNSLTHEFNVATIAKLEAQQEEIFQTMDYFINLISNAINLSV